MKVIISTIGILSTLIASTSAFAVETERRTTTAVEWIGGASWHDCGANGAFPHEFMCEYFYDCYHGTPGLGLCTAGYLFDLNYNGCNVPSSVNCGGRSRPQDFPREPFICLSPNGQYSNLDDCTGYITCENNIPTYRSCEYGWYYNTKPPEDRCTSPEDVDCGIRPIPTQRSNN